MFSDDEEIERLESERYNENSEEHHAEHSDVVPEDSVDNISTEGEGMQQQTAESNAAPEGYVDHDGEEELADFGNDDIYAVYEYTESDTEEATDNSSDVEDASAYAEDTSYDYNDAEPEEVHEYQDADDGYDYSANYENDHHAEYEQEEVIDYSDDDIVPEPLVPIKGLTKVFSFYSNKREKILGVDISPHYIRVSQISYTKRGRVLKNLTSVCIEDMYTNDDIASNLDLYAENLKQLVDSFNIKVNKVAVTLPVSGSIVQVATIPQMTAQELQEAAQVPAVWQNLVNISEDLTNYTTFYQILSRNNTRGTMDIMFVATPNMNVQLYAELIKRAGLELVIADLRCFALYNSYFNNIEDRDANGLVSFLEFGIDENYLFVAGDNKYKLYDVYISDEDKHALIYENEDRTKISRIIYNYAEQLFYIADSLKSDFGGQELKHIYASSSLPLYVNNPALPPLIKTFIQELASHFQDKDVQVTDCEFCDHIVVPEQFTKTVSAEGRLADWAVTIGMAMHKVDAFNTAQGIKRLTNINLNKAVMPLQSMERMIVKSTLGLVVMIVSCVTVFSAVGAFLWLDSLELEKKIFKIKSVESTYKEKKKAVDELSGVVVKMKSLDNTRQLVPSNQDLLISMHDVIRKSIPRGVWLSEMNFEAPNSVDIKGNSLNDANIVKFINAMNSSNVFSEIALKQMEAIREKNLYSYSQESILIKSFVIKGTINTDVIE